MQKSLKRDLKGYKKISWAPEIVPVLLYLRTVDYIDKDCLELLKDSSDYLLGIEANIAAISVVVDEENLECRLIYNAPDMHKSLFNVHIFGYCNQLLNGTKLEFNNSFY